MRSGLPTVALAANTPPATQADDIAIVIARLPIIGPPQVETTVGRSERRLYGPRAAPDAGQTPLRAGYSGEAAGRRRNIQAWKANAPRRSAASEKTGSSSAAVNTDSVASAEPS